jgi:6-phosphogluconolactonase
MPSSSITRPITRPITRRHFLAASVALPFSLRALAATPLPHWVFIGTGTDKGIFRASWNPQTGELGDIALAAPTNHPNYFAMHPTLPVLYTVNESTGPAAAVSSFRVDRSHGTLTQTSRLSSHGDGPCYISVDRTGQDAFAANYAGGSFSAFGLGPAGELRDLAGAFDCRNNPACGALGPVHDRQDAAHVHCAVISPANDFVLACNLGEDAIEVFPIAPGATHPLGTPMRVPARPGSGPRHVAFHPNRRWLYCIHELDCTVDLYDWSPQPHEESPQPHEESPQPHEHGAQPGFPSMHLRNGSVVSTLAPGAALTGNTACELIVSDDGRFLTTCTRGTGSNSITVYRIAPATGLLTMQQRLSCGGAIPRYMAFDPSRRWLVVTNQGTADGKTPGNIAVFAHDPATGRLRETPHIYAADVPMFVLFV